jgi:DNA polymerase-3 subunit gamma/tau
VRPSRARFKIYIIDEVHMLTREAFNALLKTLEEPPEHVKFVFCTTDPGKIPITVLSRCQRYDFAPVETAAIAQRLGQIVEAEGAQADPEALQLLARRAAGSMRDSQSLLEQLLAFAGDRITVEDVHQMLGTARSSRLRALVGHLIGGDAAGALSELDAAVEEGVDPGQLTEQLLGYLRDMMVIAVEGGVDLLLHTSDAEYPALVDGVRQWGIETIVAAAQILDQSVARMRQSVHVRTLAEVAIVRIARLDDLDSLPELIAQLKAGTLGPEVPRRAATSPPTTGSEQPAPAAPGKKKRAPASSVPDLNPTDDGPARRPGQTGLDERAPERHQAPETRSRPDQPDPPPPDRSCSPSSAPPVAAPEADIWQGVTREAAEQIWHQALDYLNDMTADCARRFHSVATSAPNRLVVNFKSQYNSSKTYCEGQQRLRRLEHAVAQVSGKAVRLELRLLDDGRAEITPDEPVVSVRQRMREVQTHPMVRKAVELFGAEVSSVDLPSSGDS